MSRKSLVASLAVLLLVPALVYAGLNIAQITTGPASGSFITYRGFKNLSSVVSKQSLSGYAAGAKTFNLRAHTFYGYTSAPIVTNNGIKQVVTAVFNNRSTWTYGWNCKICRIYGSRCNTNHICRGHCHLPILDAPASWQKKKERNKVPHSSVDAYPYIIPIHTNHVYIHMRYI